MKKLIIFAIVMLAWGSICKAQHAVKLYGATVSTDTSLTKGIIKSTYYADDDTGIVLYTPSGLQIRVAKDFFTRGATGITAYTAYAYEQGEPYEDTPRDGMGSFSMSGRYGVANGWYEFGPPGNKTTDKLRYTSDFITWTTVTAPWRDGHSFAMNVYQDTLYKYLNDYGNDYATYDMSAWKAYFVGSTLTFQQLDDSMDIPPTILAGSCVDDSGYHYIIGGQDKFGSGAVLRTAVYRTRDFITYELRASNIPGLGGNKWGCVAYRNGTIYVTSGGLYTGSRTYSDSVIALTNGGATATYLAPFPGIAVQYPTSVLDTATQRIYFAFGATITDGNQKQILYLDTNNQWYRVLNDTIPARHAASGTLHNGHIVYAGGQMVEPDVWIGDFTTKTYTNGLQNARTGDILIGDNADHLLTLTKGADGASTLSEAVGNGTYARLAADNTFTGTNQFGDVGLNEIAVSPATVLTGVAKISNYTSESIESFNATGIFWKNIYNKYGLILRCDPTSGDNTYGLRVHLGRDNTSSIIMALSSASTNGSNGIIHHMWRGDGSYYNPTRFAYSGGGKVYDITNTLTNIREYVTTIPTADVTGLDAALGAKIDTASALRSGGQLSGAFTGGTVTGNTGNITFIQGGSSMMQILNSKGIRLGSTTVVNTATFPFDFRAAGANILNLATAKSGLTANDGLAIKLDTVGTQEASIINKESGALILGAGNAEGMRITPTSRVLIGGSTDAGAYPLQITGDSYFNGASYLSPITEPATPATGGVLWSETGGTLKYKKADGSITTLVP